MKPLKAFAKTKKKPWEVEGVEWREVRLGELTTEKPRYGLTAKAKNKGKFVFLRITDIDDKGEIKNDSFKFVDLNETEKAKYDIKKGDLLLARSGSVGNFFVALRDYSDWVFASYLIRFRLDLNKVDLVFVKYFLSSQYFKRWISYQKRPGAQPNINAKEYSSFKLPLPFRNGKPDLETQKKIVEYIEANFSIIDKILEKKKKELQKFDELWESVLEKAFKPKEGEEWREVRLGEISHIESGSRPKGGVKKYTGGIPSIGGEHLNYDGNFSFENLRYIPESFYEQSNKGKIKKFDILIVKDGATTGKTAFVGDDFPFEKAMVNEHVFLCRIIDGRIYPKFVFRFLMSKEGQNRILKTKGGTAQGGINKRFSKLVKIPLPFRNGKPDIEKQKEIAQYLDDIYEKIKTLKEKIQNQINQLEELKESILDEVFSYENTV